MRNHGDDGVAAQVDNLINGYQSNPSRNVGNTGCRHAFEE
jgi:hypothetical protein